MAIISTTPKTFTHPDIPFDRLGVSLAISPVWQPTDVEAAMSIRAVPYRVLPDGSIDKDENSAWTFSTGSAFADAQNDSALAVASSTLMTAIQDFLTAKGA